VQLQQAVHPARLFSSELSFRGNIKQLLQQ